jgi:hypothetical protein
VPPALLLELPWRDPQRRRTRPRSGRARRLTRGTRARRAPRSVAPARPRRPRAGARPTVAARVPVMLDPLPPNSMTDTSQGPAVPGSRVMEFRPAPAGGRVRPMLVLALSTSTPRGSVALVRDGEVLGRAVHSELRAHAERLFAGIDEVCASGRGCCAARSSWSPATWVRARSPACASRWPLRWASRSRSTSPQWASLRSRRWRRPRSQARRSGARALAALDAQKDELFIGDYELDPSGALREADADRRADALGGRSPPRARNAAGAPRGRRRCRARWCRSVELHRRGHAARRRLRRPARRAAGERGPAPRVARAGVCEASRHHPVGSRCSPPDRTFSVGFVEHVGGLRRAGKRGSDARRGRPGRACFPRRAPARALRVPLRARRRHLPRRARRARGVPPRGGARPPHQARAGRRALADGAQAGRPVRRVRAA